MIESMSKEDFFKKAVLHIEKLEDGMNKYSSIILFGKEEQMRALLQYFMEKSLNGSYVDFYYGELSEVEKQNFVEGLNRKEQEILSRFAIEKQQVYFVLTEDNLQFLSSITAREWLFSTFYFVDPPVTIWGNYGNKYPLFAKDEDTLEYCKKVALKVGLTFT